jgi:DNA polymerase-3 subunit epsilon
MSPFANILRSAPRLTPDLEDRLQLLAERSPPPTRNRHRASRYVTVDIETTGQDPRHDRLLSIGAVSIDQGRIDLSQCFEVVLKQPETSSHENILVHRIGGLRQISGVDPGNALVQFLEYVAHAPLVAYRFEFTRTMLDRTLKEHLHVRTQSRWIDLTRLLTALYPSDETRTLDDWLNLMGIHILEHHDALAGALATAQMLQVCLPRADGSNLTCPQHLIEMHKPRHWLSRS